MNADSEGARDGAQDEDRLDEIAPTDAEAEADRASEGLRNQIAALRRQVKDAQEELIEQERRRKDGRSFKR